MRAHARRRSAAHRHHGAGRERDRQLWQSRATSRPRRNRLFAQPIPRRARAARRQERHLDAGIRLETPTRRSTPGTSRVTSTRSPRPGKAELDLPMYVNAALSDPFKDEGAQYGASGGPNWNVIDIWKAAAPHIDIDRARHLRPRPREICEVARPLPPARQRRCSFPRPATTPAIRAFLWLALGNGAIGWSPFGMDATGYSNFPLGAQPARRRDARRVRVQISPCSRRSRATGRSCRSSIRRAGFAKPQDGADQTAVARPLEDHRDVRHVGVRRARLDLDRHAAQSQEGADPSAAPRSFSSGPTNSSLAGSDVRMRIRARRPPTGREVAVPRRRGRHVRERPLGDGAPLERRPDRLWTEPDRRRCCSRFGWGPTDETSGVRLRHGGVAVRPRFAQTRRARRRTGIIVTSDGRARVVRLQVYRRWHHPGDRGADRQRSTCRRA